MSTHRELLPVELLVRDDQRVDDHTRRVSVAEHEQFQKHLAASLADQQPVDEIDASLEADPMIERIARRRKNSEAARTLAILDELERSNEA
jgi:hypothetical protein